MSDVNSTYCLTNCPVGRKASRRFLEEAESAFDAALDMQDFVGECLKGGCLYEKERDASGQESAESLE